MGHGDLLTSLTISVILSPLMRKLANSIKDILLAFLNFIYPKQCQGCGVKLHYKNKYYLCEECLGKVKVNNPPFCLKCGHPLSGPADLKVVCGKCSGIKYNFDKAFYCCNYEGLVKELVHKFKYNHKKFLICLFNELMTNFIKRHISTKSMDMVVPIPLHRGKLQQRGFDQALLLSKNLSKTFNLQMSYNILNRKKDTKQQANLNKAQRLKNIKGAFSIKDKTVFNKKSVLLIDDIFTTAATANECAHLLKEAGAKSVSLLALAKSS